MTDHNTVSSEARGIGRAGLREWVVETKWLGGSVVAWASLAVTLVGGAITFGATQASVNGELDNVKYQITRNRDESQDRLTRNRDEALDRIKSIEGSVSNLYTSMTAIHSIKTDVEVIKSQIQSINNAMSRIERAGRQPATR